MYLPRDKGGRGLSSIEREYKETKVEVAGQVVPEQRSGYEDGA